VHKIFAITGNKMTLHIKNLAFL